MTSRVGLIGLASLASLALSTAAYAQTTRSTGGIAIVFSDITISSMHGGHTVTTTRIDRQGGFRFELPAGDYDICLNGPGLRSAIDRSGGGQGEDHIIGVLIGLLLPAVQAAPAERRLTFPGAASGPGQDGRRGPSPAARDLCFPYTVNAGPGPADEGVTRRTNQPIVTRDVDNLSQAPADGGRAGGVPVAVGDVNGDGRADRQVDPRIPPPDARSAPARAGTLSTVTVAGSIRLVR